MVAQHHGVGIGKTRFLTLTACVLLACLSCNKRTRMTLISNQENTLFELRRPGESNWTRIGKGKIVYTEVRKNESCEIRARPHGYASKVHTLANPVRDLRFTFEISDKDTVIKELFFELDVRAVEVATAKTVSSAHDRAEGPGDLRRSVELCARGLVDSGRLAGTIAVVPFEDIGAGVGRLYGETACNMMISALQSKPDCVLIERSQLATILAEHDLSLAQIAKNPGLLGQVAGIDYLVIGSLSTMR